MEELDLKEIFNMFWARIVYIVLIVLIFSVVGILYTYLYVTPKYKSVTKLVLTTSTEGNKTTSGGTITSSDITLNNNIIATYRDIITSNTVLKQVINNLQIDISENALKSKISIITEKSTQLLEIAVVDENAYQAKVIANEVAKVFEEQVPQIYKLNNVYILDEAEEETTPYNINHIKDIAIFSFIGLVAACIYVLIANMLDTTVKSKEDVERKLGLTVLVDIPVCTFDELPRALKKGGKK